MLTSLGLIFLLGLLMAAICQKIHLPRIIGMLFTGIILGPYVLNLLDTSTLNISSELRQSWERYWQPCHLPSWYREWYISWRMGMARRKVFPR